MSKKRSKKRSGGFSSTYKSLILSMPLSFKLLTGYAALLGFFYLTFIFIPNTVLFGVVFDGVLAQFINLVFVALIFAIIYGIVKKEHWAWSLLIGWFTFEIFNSLLSTFFVQKESLISGFMTAASLYILVVNGVILWFIYNKKDYFFNKKYKYKTEDKVFVFSLVILVVMMLILVTSSATTIYVDTTYLSKELIGELNQMSLDQAVLYCNGKYAQEKDVCYVVLAVAYKNMPVEYCDNVEFSFYKATCIKAAGS